MESAIEFPDFFTVKFNNHAKIDEKEPFVLYSITVHTNFSCYHIYKRYSDFSKLNDRIMAIKSEAENSTHHDCFKNLPAFHGSSLYYWNLDEGFIQERKGQLEKYSQSLLQFYHKFSDRNHHKNVMFKKCKVKSYKKYSMNSVKEQIVSGTTHLDLDSSSDTDEGETFQNYEKNQHQEIKILDTINEFFSVSEIFNIETTMTIKIQRAFRSSKFNSGLRKLKKSVYSCLGYT